jgi:hypothetical protein
MHGALEQVLGTPRGARAKGRAPQLPAMRRISLINDLAILHTDLPDGLLLLQDVTFEANLGRTTIHVAPTAGRVSPQASAGASPA